MTITINGTTGISGVDGSAGTPAVQGTDTNTGVFYPAADTVGVSTGGSERVRVDSSGNFGVGTSTFNSVRTVIQGSQTGGAPQTSGTAQTYGLLRLQGTTFTSVLDFGTNGGNYNWIQATDNANLATNYNLAINPNGGNVGIGTSSPAVKLDINGITGWNGATTGQTAQIVGASSGIGGGGNFRVLSNTTQAVDVGGVLTLGGYHTTTTASVDFASILGAKENSTGGNTAGYLAFGTRPNAGNMTERMRIDSSGNVAITQTPGRYTIDTSGGLTSFANGGTVDFSNASGMLVVNNATNGAVTIYLCGGGSTSAVASVGGQVGTLTYVAGIAGYRWTNNYGSTASVGFFFVRTRATA